jgi:hypothetical protein
MNATPNSANWIGGDNFDPDIVDTDCRRLANQWLPDTGQGPNEPTSANSGRASLEAAANPTRTKQLNFVADGASGPAFTETLRAAPEECCTATRDRARSFWPVNTKVPADGVNVAEPEDAHTFRSKCLPDKWSEWSECACGRGVSSSEGIWFPSDLFTFKKLFVVKGLPTIPTSAARIDTSANGWGRSGSLGWRDMVKTVASTFRALSLQDQARTAILASNYGEAAALDVYGPAEGLPAPLSGPNQYWLWGPRGQEGALILHVGGRAEHWRHLCGAVEVVGTFGGPYVMPYEDNRPIFVCRDPRIPLTQLWAGCGAFVRRHKTTELAHRRSWPLS